eukprot:1790014-Pyramimonas_sp.AAC.1
MSVCQATAIQDYDDVPMVTGTDRCTVARRIADDDGGDDDDEMMVIMMTMMDGDNVGDDGYDADEVDSDTKNAADADGAD